MTNECLGSTYRTATIGPAPRQRMIRRMAPRSDWVIFVRSGEAYESDQNQEERNHPVKKCTVSVIMSSYNHAPFVADAINSVLNQTYSDFEFLIADDGSSDTTPDVIGRFTDSRIGFTDFRVNRGAALVTNELIERASGKYVALINSDDIWLLEKLARQVDTLESNPHIAAVFGQPTYIDREGKHMAEEDVPRWMVNRFRQKDRSQGQWLRYFFVSGNCICHPTMLIRREVYQTLGGYDNRLRQVPDFDMWVRFVKFFQLHVSDEVEIMFRLLGAENASGHSRPNVNRANVELYQLAGRFFANVTPGMLCDGFSDLMVNKSAPSRIHADIEETLLYFSSDVLSRPIYQVAGLTRLYKLLGSSEHREVLACEYQIDDRYFQNLGGKADVFAPVPEQFLPDIAGTTLARELWERIRRRWGR